MSTCKDKESDRQAGETPETALRREDILSLFDRMPLAVMVLDENAHIVAANRCAAKLTGGRATDPPGRCVGDAIGCDHACASTEGCGGVCACRRCEMGSAVRRGASRVPVEPFETVVSCNRFEKRCLRVAVTPLEDAGGDPASRASRALLSIEDVTDSRYTQRLSTAMAAIGTVCHDISQPLMTCMGNLEMLSMDHPELDRLPLIIEQLNRLAELNGRLRAIRRSATLPAGNAAARPARSG